MVQRHQPTLYLHSESFKQAIVGNEHAASAFTTMSQLRTGRDGSDVPSETSRSFIPSRAQQRRTFTTEETEAVGKYFAAIEERVSVTAKGSFSLRSWTERQRTFKIR